ncbi:MAG: ABC transporter substrate-binding protein [Candidatus Ranarchaeia archaeon]|jgi:ABC-type glycerol-3-phosphate transport system substrate-binding protein
MRKINRKAITQMQTIIIIAVVVIAAVIGTYFASTMLLAPGDGRDVTITVITQYQTGDDAAAMQGVNDMFMDKYPNIIVKHQPLPWLEFNTILPVWMGTDSAPDVWQWWGGAKTQFIANQGHILDLSDVSATIQDQFPAGIYDEYCEYNGKVYAVPNFLHSHGVWYNKAIFEEYNIDIPETWDELVAACETIWTQSGNTVYPFVVAAMFPWLPDLQFANVLGKTVGGDFFNRLVAGQESWTDSSVIDALASYGELVPYMPPYITELDEMGVAAEFGAGNVAMEIQGIWRGAMAEEAGLSPNDVGWFPVPEITPAYSHTMGSAADVLVGSSNTLFPEEVKLYLEFWATL